MAAAAAADPEVAVLCYVDSLRGIELLEGAIAQDHPLGVLVELGSDGGRTGCRSTDEAASVARRVRASSDLRPAGVSGYEGVICHDRSPECLDRVSAFLDRLADLARAVLGEGPAETGEPFVVSAGGSVFFDRVVERLRGPWPGDSPVRVVLRSGCYLTHDHGANERTSPMPASLGEGFGKRDAPHDLELPIPAVVRTPDGGLRAVDGALSVRELNDQHTYVDVADGFGLEVGQVVGLGVSHPCTAFDKWRVVPVLDDGDRVVDAIATAF